jgi:prepilin-type N-terminal cleavage/methylation domain-containing protein
VRPVSHDKGFTLIEVMISILILFIGMMAVLDFLCVYQKFNIENTIKNEAMKVAEMRLEQLRSQDFLTLPIGTAVAEPNVVRRIRNMQINYGVTRTVQIITPNSRAVQIDIQWTYPIGRVRTFNAQTIISNEV